MISFPTRQQFAVLLIVIASVGLIICMGSFFHARYVLGTYSVTHGRVIEVRPRQVGHDEIAYFAVFSFADAAGTVHVVHSGMGSSPAQEKVGDIIPVLYPPHAPDGARFGSPNYVWGLTAGSGVSSIFVLCVG